MQLNMVLLKERFGVTRLDPQMEIPHWALLSRHFLSITRTEDELSIVCEQNHLPDSVIAEKNFRGLKIIGPLSFSLAGVLNALSKPLAEAHVSVFVISTFDTAYLLVKESSLPEALKALSSLCNFKESEGLL